MDRDTVIALAREAGLKLFNEGWISSDNGDAVTEEALERFAALVAAHEREECAKVCDTQARMWDHIDVTGRRNSDLVDASNICAAAIRSRT